MSDETTNDDDKTTEGTETATAETEQKSDSLTQADVDRIVNERLKRERAKFADYDELKAAKAKLDEIEESKKSEIEKLSDRAAQAEARAAEVELRALKAEVAAEKGVPASLLSGSNLEELTAAADALVAFRGEKPKPDFGGGDRGTDVTAQGGQITSREALKSMTPDEINQARLDGRLDTLLGRKA